MAGVYVVEVIKGLDPRRLHVIHDEVDISGCPNRLDRGQVDAKYIGTRVQVTHCVEESTT